MFSEEAWYPEGYISNAGWNKLFGAGAIFHKQRSARFVWNPDYDFPGIFKIKGYVYENGIWTDYDLGFSLAVGQWAELEIERNQDGYMFITPFGELQVNHRRPTLRKALQPYFGGRDTAYRTMYIKIK